MNKFAPITRAAAAGNVRLGTLPFVFGRYALWVESMAFEWMRRLNTTYTGGHWEFYNLSNDGFYMATTDTQEHSISAPNGYEVKVSSDAAGIVACLYALNTLANSTGDDLLIAKFHQLRDYALEHPEREAILAAID